MCIVKAVSFSATTNGGSPLDGDWKLDRSRDVGSMDALLKAMGVDYFTRMAVATLDMTDHYTIQATEFYMQRHTSIRDTEQRFHVNVVEDVQDPMLGLVHSIVRVSEDLGRVMVTMTRPSDQAVFISLRHLMTPSRSGKPPVIVCSMNFTLPNNGGKTSCVRYFVKQ